MSFELKQIKYKKNYQSKSPPINLFFKWWSPRKAPNPLPLPLTIATQTFPIVTKNKEISFPGHRSSGPFRATDNKLFKYYHLWVPRPCPPHFPLKSHYHDTSIARRLRTRVCVCVRAHWNIVIRYTTFTPKIISRKLPPASEGRVTFWKKSSPPHPPHYGRYHTWKCKKPEACRGRKSGRKNPHQLSLCEMSRTETTR